MKKTLVALSLMCMLGVGLVGCTTNGTVKTTPTPAGNVVYGTYGRTNVAEERANLTADKATTAGNKVVRGAGDVGRGIVTGTGDVVKGVGRGVEDLGTGVNRTVQR